MRVRLFQAGDLPGSGDRINVKKVKQLVNACNGLQVWAYSHKPLNVGNNKKIIKYCNKNGLTINLSANNLKHADKLVKAKVGPVTVVLPENTNKRVKTPAGNQVNICPAVMNEKVTCSNCGGTKGPLCYNVDRKFIIGFPAHGAARKIVSKMVNND